MKKTLLINVFSIFFKMPMYWSIWPPPYKIHLDHSEEFVIFDNFESSDDVYSDEDEMIKPKDLQHFFKPNDNQKYYKIHKFAMEMGKKQTANFSKHLVNHITKIKWKETNFDTEDDIPYVAGIFDSESQNILKENANVYYFNEMAKSLIAQNVNQKRGDIIIKKKRVTENEMDLEYNYNEYKKEYDMEVVNLENDTDTLQFVEVDEEETLKDAIKKMMDFRKPSNCSEEEAKGIGVGAIECFKDDFDHYQEIDKKLLMKRIFRVVMIWFVVYLLIAIPLWCEKGWCCCCCRCKFCRPQERIDDVKKFLADNPPGIYKTPDGYVTKYTPTHYEKYSHKRLEQAVMKL